MNSTKGYFTLAQGEMYVRCAYALALSLKVSQSNVSKLTIGVEKLSDVKPEWVDAFDQIVEIPWGDHSAGETWKRKNEWKAPYMTPYDETVKLDADMLFLSDVSHWWDLMENQELVFATKVMTYRNQIADDSAYRETFITNRLPNIYTAFMYFKKTDEVYEYFKLAENITNNWERYYEEFLDSNSRPKQMSADVVFALAAKIQGTDEWNTNSHFEYPTFVHMKTQLQGWDTTLLGEDWPNFVQTYFTPDCQLKVGDYLQTMPFHYHRREFLTDEVIMYLERKAANVRSL